MNGARLFAGGILLVAVTLGFLAWIQPGNVMTLITATSLCQ